jgi:GNAT superfamily N-acetyltransferase
LAVRLCDRVPVLIRPRTDDDREACVAMAQEIHERDRYPIFLPDDLWSFLSHPSAIGIWVAESEGRMVGHVALHGSSMPGVVALASESLGVATDRLGVVARLMVSPSARRMGLGQTLLEWATREALERGLYPVLDVVTDHTAAIALYERLGWIRAGVVTSELSMGKTFEEIVYLAPASRSPGSCVQND